MNINLKKLFNVCFSREKQEKKRDLIIMYSKKIMVPKFQIRYHQKKIQSELLKQLLHMN